MKKQWLIILFIFLLSFNSISQSKVAHIDTYELIKSMPEMIQVEVDLKKWEEEKNNEFEDLRAAIKAKAREYNAIALELSNEENEENVKEIEVMENNVFDYMRQSQEEYQKKHDLLIQPIIEKANNAIEAVGREKGFDYVIDSSKGQGLLLADGTDIMADVKIYLGF